MKTIDFPTQRVVKLTLSSAYNSTTNGGDIQKSHPGGSDWLGKDDGSRAFPEKPLADGIELGKTLPNTWGQRSEKAPVSGNFNLNIGDAVPIGSNTLGYIAGLSYRNGYSRAERGFDYFRSGTRIVEGEGTVDSYNVLWGGLLDLNFKLAGNHKISWKNSYNQSAQENVSLFETVDENLQYNVTYDTEWEERQLYVTKLSGEHFFQSENSFELLWQGSYIESSADEPDHRTARYSRNVDLPEDPLATGLGQRSWSELKEYTRSFGADMIFHLGDSRIKFGALAEGKTRDYQIKFYLVEPDGFDGYALLTQPMDSVYQQEHFAPGLLTMSRLDNPRDLYDGRSDLYAAYLMADLPFQFFSQNFRLLGGARVENSDIRVNTISPTSTSDPYAAILHKVDVLPSLNLTYLFNEITNVRLAYSQSVNRPEFREMASFYFYDYVTGQGKYGNPYLSRAFSKNYDARIEIFPGVGELFAVGYFYKDISGAIEQQILISSNPELTWFNSPAGKNYGWEVEARKNLGFLGGYFANFAIAGNYTRVFSEILYPLYLGASEYGVREMQGQAPWVINASFIFREPNLGTTVSLLYNEFGKRLEAVGDQRQLDVFEEPLAIFDVAITQPITSGLGLKFTARDVGARTRTFITREGNPYSSIYRGTSYSLEASITL
jgi:TonB-dependent receptor